MVLYNIAFFFDFKCLIAFVSGLLSFFTPCVLPLVPSYLVYISGITFDHYNELRSEKYRKNLLLHVVSFIGGFSAVFIAMGFSTSLLGNLLASFQVYIVKVGGLFLIIMGLFYLNILKIPLLNHEKLFQLKKKHIGIMGSFLIGVTFSLGWTPCVGPVLSSILVMASTTKNVMKGTYLLCLYSLGLALPFFISAILFDRLFGILKKYSKFSRYTLKALGLLLVLLGLMLCTSYHNEWSLRLGRMLSF